MNKFLIHYQNGMRRHVKRLERDLLAASLTQIGPREYKVNSPNSLKNELEQTNGPRYLQGKFNVQQPDGQVVSERLESVTGMIARLVRQGVLEVNQRT